MRAGTPRASTSSGRLFVTTAPAPTTVRAPMATRDRMVAPLPMNAHSPIVTRPPTRAPGPTAAPGAMTQSCSTTAAVLIMTVSPIRAFELTTALAPIMIPHPSAADGATREGFLDGAPYGGSVHQEAALRGVVVDEGDALETCFRSQDIEDYPALRAGPYDHGFHCGIAPPAVFDPRSVAGVPLSSDWPGPNRPRLTRWRARLRPLLRSAPGSTPGTWAARALRARRSPRPGTIPPGTSHPDRHFEGGPGWGSEFRSARPRRSWLPPRRRGAERGWRRRGTRGAQRASRAAGPRPGRPASRRRWPRWRGGLRSKPPGGEASRAGWRPACLPAGS